MNNITEVNGKTMLEIITESYPINSEELRGALAGVFENEGDVSRVTNDLTASYTLTAATLTDIEPNWTQIKMNHVGKKDLSASFRKMSVKFGIAPGIIEQVYLVFRAVKDLGNDQTWQAIQRKALHYTGTKPENVDNVNHPDNKEKEDDVEETASARVEKVRKVLTSQLKHLENWEGEVDSNMLELCEGLRNILDMDILES
tara:strand:- start:174 stop:776 length:603 start_codon:yes stop_codon:yes gene_type:complete